jgi:hypothetical protein
VTQSRFVGDGRGAGRRDLGAFGRDCAAVECRCVLAVLSLGPRVCAGPLWRFAPSLGRILAVRSGGVAVGLLLGMTAAGPFVGDGRRGAVDVF